MQLFAAPLQGYTEAPFRHHHAEVYGASQGAADLYFTPFVRVEHGEPRSRDLRDATSPLDSGNRVIPQIIARDQAEFAMLTSVLVDNGHSAIDLNMGCPFTPQVKKGRGSALVSRRDILAAISAEMHRRHNTDGTRFSIKMRLGVESADDWRATIDIVNSMPLDHVTVHPRIAAQQYGGSLNLDEFAELFSQLQLPVVFNGDITTPADIDAILMRFPSLTAIMTGRGLLARPSLLAEWRQGRTWESSERLRHIMELHDRVRHHYESTLCGETQILSKLRPFWDYLEPEIGHKTWKALHKATTLSRYLQSIHTIDC